MAKVLMIAVAAVLVASPLGAQVPMDRWFATGSNPELYVMGPDATRLRDGRPTLTVQSRPGAREQLTECLECYGTYAQMTGAEPYRGRIRVSALVKSEGVERFAALWIRVNDAQFQSVAFDNLQARVEGTTGWARREVVVPVGPEAAHVVVGVLVSGPGQVWIDDLKLEGLEQGTTVELGEEAIGLAGGSCTTPKHWVVAGSLPEAYEMCVDTEVTRSGRGASASVRSRHTVDHGFGTLMQPTKADAYRGKRIRLSGWARSENVEPGWAGFWLRVDGPVANPQEQNILAFDNMADRPIEGTTDWKRYEIVLDVAESAEGLFYGLLLDGTGTVWMDDLELEVVSADVPLTDKSALLVTTKKPRNLRFEE